MKTKLPWRTLLLLGPWGALRLIGAGQPAPAATEPTAAPPAAAADATSAESASADVTETLVPPATPAEAGTPAVAEDEELRQLIQQFREQRNAYLEARQQLRERLRNANEEERRLILQAFRQEQQEQIAAQREARREFRRLQMEIRRQRRHRAGSAGDNN